MTGIYVLRNKINNKEYVGQSVDVKGRMYAHRRPSWSEAFIDRAINKYGWDNFEINIMYDVPEALLNYFEIEMIKKRNCLSPNGYNLEEGGSRGRPSQETRERMSRGQKGNTNLLGYKHTKESRAKISKALLGSKRGPYKKKETK